MSLGETAIGGASGERHRSGRVCTGSVWRATERPQITRAVLSVICSRRAGRGDDTDPAKNGQPLDELTVWQSARATEASQRRVLATAAHLLKQIRASSLAVFCQCGEGEDGRGGRQHGTKGLITSWVGQGPAASCRTLRNAVSGRRAYHCPRLAIVAPCLPDIVGVASRHELWLSAQSAFAEAGCRTAPPA